MPTRKGRTYVDPCFECGIRGRQFVAPYVSILVNNIEVSGEAVKNTPPDFIVYTMLMTGGVVYERSTNMWFRFKNDGRLNRYNMPQSIRLYVSDDLLSTSRKVNDNYCIFPANAEFFPPVKELIPRINLRNKTWENISQNLSALRQATAVIYSDSELSNQIILANRQREAGETCVTLQSKGNSWNNGVNDIRLENFSGGAQSYLTEYIQLLAAIGDELDSMVGVTHLTDTPERRTDDEVAAIVNSTGRIIDLIVSAGNKYAAYYGVDVHFKKREQTPAAVSNTPPTTSEIEEGI